MIFCRIRHLVFDCKATTSFFPTEVGLLYLLTLILGLEPLDALFIPKMSAILSADDLNDFISPGVACIKPVETLPLQHPQKSEVRFFPTSRPFYANPYQECLRSHPRGQSHFQ